MERGSDTNVVAGQATMNPFRHETRGRAGQHAAATSLAPRPHQPRTILRLRLQAWLTAHTLEIHEWRFRGRVGGRGAVLVAVWSEERLFQCARRQRLPTTGEFVTQRDSGLRCVWHGMSHWQFAVGAQSGRAQLPPGPWSPSRRLSACTLVPSPHPRRGIVGAARRWPITRPAGQRWRGSPRRPHR